MSVSSQLFRLDTGEGRTVVFVHGTPSSSFEFRGVFDLLAGESRCIAFDHLGFGQSAKPSDGDYSLRAHQVRFGQALDGLEFDKAVFVLHDFGTAIALPWMLQNPSRVDGVVLLNTFLWPATGAIRWILSFYASAMGRWLYRVGNLSAKYLLPYGWGTHKPLTASLHASYLAPFERAEDRYATAALPGELLGATLADLAPQAVRLSQWPVRIVWGMADALVGPSELDRWKQILPEVSVDEWPDVGHFVAEEVPEAVEAAVRALWMETD